jgi:uncharacterized protein (TIGR02270 family)
MSDAFIPAVADRLGNTIAELWQLRSIAVDAPNYSLTDLAELDERLDASLDALRTMGPAAIRRCESALSLDSAGALFTAGLFSLEGRDGPRTHNLCAVAEAIPETREGLHDAFCWVSPEFLRGSVKALLDSSSLFERSVGIVASAAHRVNPGQHLVDGLNSPATDLLTATLRAVGELGVTDALDLLDGLDDDGGRFWARWSAVLLGDRGRGLDALLAAGVEPGPHRPRAFQLALQATPRNDGHRLLQALARDSTQMRWLICGSGIVGDPAYVPWLIDHMATPEEARLAGEAFTLITGVDLPSSDLDTTRPEGFESGPNDDPKDSNVEMDPDAGLPWPDPKRIKAWWALNSSRFQSGSRSFMGAPVTRGHCLDILRNGYQRQRILAAVYLCLLTPGTSLFNTSAPAWRQQKLLAQMK